MNRRRDTRLGGYDIMSKSPLETGFRGVFPWAADVLVCPMFTLDTSFQRADREVCRAQLAGSSKVSGTKVRATFA